VDIFTPINQAVGSGSTLPVVHARKKWSLIATLSMTMTMLLQCMRSVLFLGLFTSPVAVLLVSVIQRAVVRMHHAVVAVLINEAWVAWEV
jgi:hypothetical protein